MSEASLPKSLRPRVPTTRAHVPYFNQYLNEDYCHADGEQWPCLYERQSNPKCKCSHARITHSTRTGDCWQYPCGCGEFRPQETA